MEITNTFEGGLNKDNNILLQPRGTYRDMNNGMLVSYDGNDYVIELPKGTKVSFSIPAIYNGNEGSKQNPPSVIGYISFIDTLIVFSTNNKNNNYGYGEIGQVSFNKDGLGEYTPLYGYSSLNFSMDNQITGFTFEENDRIKRVYWTDNYNEPRVLNVKDTAFNPVSSTEINLDEQYMVLGGVVNYGGQKYGPGMTLGNVFTGTALTTYTVVADYPIVYTYIDYKLLAWNPDRINPEIDFNKYVAGTLYGGSKSYFVRYSVKNQGVKTSWSYGSFPINVYSINDYGTYEYEKVEGNGAESVLQNSTTGVELKISGINTYYDTIEVAAAEYDQVNNVLRSANIFSTLGITGETMYIQHTSEGGTSLSIDELTIFPASILRAKDITTNRNYNVIGNISERNELNDFTKDGVNIGNLTYEMIGQYSYGVNSSFYEMKAGSPKQSSGNVTSGNLIRGGIYVVKQGVINYNGTNYGVGYESTFKATTGVTYSVVTSPYTVKACIRLSKYSPLSTPLVKKYKIIELNDDFFDYRGMAATQYLRQYWGGETYRFGVLPYDKKGNPMYVRWIGDKQIQTNGQKLGSMNAYGSDNTGDSYVLKLNGVQISGIKFSAEDMAKMDGFSIVRAPRDKQYYAQGIAFQTVSKFIGEGPGGAVYPMPLEKLHYSEYYENETQISNSNIISWYSPDVLFEKVNLAANNYLEGDSLVTRDVGDITDFDDNYVYTIKLYDNFDNSFVPTNRTYKILKQALVNPGNALTDWFSNGADFKNSDIQANTSLVAPLPSGRKVVGCKQSLIELATPVLFPDGTSFGAYANRFSAAKPILNYKIPKSNLYNGSTEQALANTIYISTGHYQPINSTVLADTYDVATNSYIFNNIDVFGGDSFLGIFSIGKDLYNQLYTTTGTYAAGLFFAIETNINHYLRQGLNIQKYGMGGGPDRIYYSFNGTQRLEQFSVNDGYGSEGIIAYPALPTTYLTSNFPYRVRWAGPKTLGETQDSFRVFSQNNFRDLDGNKGQVNNVRSRDSKVFFWQDHSIGYLPMQERQLIGGELGEATQLGVSGVIDRFDNFNTYFGNQHKFGLIETEYGFAWFDFRRRAFLVMSVGGGIQEVSYVKGLRTFFNNPSQFYASEITTPSEWLQNSDNPLSGIGISGVYDPNYKMTYMNFKWIEGNTEIPVPYYKNLTIGYNHSRNVFVGFFDLKGAVWQNHNNLVLANKNIEDSPIQTSTKYYVGDTVSSNNIEYVCIKEFTTGEPIAPNQQPYAVGSIYWVKTTQSNDINLLFSTTEFCKFFGQTYNHDIEFVINPKTGKPFAVDNLRQKGNDLNYDTIYCVNDSDIVIESTDNKWYKYIDKSWNSSVPLGSNGRLVDFYMKVKLSLKTYTNNPTISRNLQKLLEFVTSVFREKR